MSQKDIIILSYTCDDFEQKCQSKDRVRLLLEKNDELESLRQSDVKTCHSIDLLVVEYIFGDKAFSEKSNPNKWAKVRIRNRDPEFSARGEVIIRNTRGRVFKEFDVSDVFIWNETPPIASHEDILDSSNDIIFDGKFRLELLIQVTRDMQHFYTPPIPSAGHIFKAYDNSEFSDVRFKVDDRIFHAHKVIVSKHSEVLANCCRDSLDGEPIPLLGVTEEIFEILLEYIYCGGLPDFSDYDYITFVELGKELICAANLFGMEDFKISVEVTLVGERVITSSNATEYLMFAESNSCALLKEYAINYVAARSEDLVNPEFFAELNECPELLREVCATIGKKAKSRDCNSGSVDELRREIALYQYGDVYGSKEALKATFLSGTKRKRN